MSNVDWRNRYGVNWISTVRDQLWSQNCWAFCMTALYEAMVRIEQDVWCRRSEGDIARGVGKQWWDFGNPGEAHAFAQNYGVADPDCFPFSAYPSIYSAREGEGALPLSPTPDRAGRTVRVPDLYATTNVSDKKLWLDSVGPMAVMVSPWYDDFGAWNPATGPYIPAVPPNVNEAHCILVVGFNDDAPEPYWIIKNSWGPNLGDQGFWYIAYSANMLESQTFVGVRFVNPDPWTKRRLRNGGLIESGNGARHNNFELFTLAGGTLQHWWRDNSNPGLNSNPFIANTLPWNFAGNVQSSDPWRPAPADAADFPSAVQSTFNRNYELLFRTTGNSVRHIYFDQKAQDWLDMTLFGPPDPIGVPGFIQSTRGAPGDFEAIILRNTGALQHWTKHNSWPWTPHLPGEWYLTEEFGSGISYAGAGLVQSRMGVTGVLESGQGELHYVCTGNNQQIHHFSRTSLSSSWQLRETFGEGITGAPVMIESQYGASNELDFGNFELCVPVSGGGVEHWYRDNHAGGGWQKAEAFSTVGFTITQIIGLLEGSINFDLEMVAECSDGHIRHFWRFLGFWFGGNLIV